MIRNRQSIEAFEKKMMAENSRTYLENLRIFEQMVIYARQLGVWPPKDLLEGIDVDIGIAKVVNVLKDH